MMTRERVLLIGGAGLLGRHLAAALAGHETVITQHVMRVPEGIALDITDEAAVRSLIADARPGIVILAAAEPHVERCEREPAATRIVNVEAARPIADAARRLGALLVVFSSEYVFGGSKGTYGEEDPTDPLNEYGRQKVELEAIARSIPRHLICRTSGVFGWEPARKNFVCQLLDRTRGGMDFVVPSDQLITPTYAPHLARALTRLLERDAVGTVHVVAPEVLPRVRFAQLVCRAFGLDRSLIVPRATDELGLAAPRPRRAGLADVKVRGLLGRPLPRAEDALAEMRAIEEVPSHR